MLLSVRMGQLYATDTSCAPRVPFDLGRPPVSACLHVQHFHHHVWPQCSHQGHDHLHDRLPAARLLCAPRPAAPETRRPARSVIQCCALCRRRKGAVCLGRQRVCPNHRQPAPSAPTGRCPRGLVTFPTITCARHQTMNTNGQRLYKVLINSRYSRST